MKILNLFLKMHFTSLSPDGQCISLAIVTEEYFNEEYRKYYTDKVEIKKGNCSIDHLITKSFYAEFSDFDINRCDDLVKENVISKLQFSDKEHMINSGSNGWKSNPCYVQSKTNVIKEMLTYWLSQFSDYKLNFIVDCGWFTWGKFVEFIGEWHIKTTYCLRAFQKSREIGITEVSVSTNSGYINPTAIDFKIGIPKLPANFPPVPQDLNDLIAFNKRITVSEAFELDRELMGLGFHEHEVAKSMKRIGSIGTKISDNKFNAFWDAKVTKEIFLQLN